MPLTQLKSNDLRSRFNQRLNTYPKAYLSAQDSEFAQVIAVDAQFDLFTRAWCVSELEKAYHRDAPFWLLLFCSKE